MVKKHGKDFLHEPKPGFLYVRVRGKYLGRLTAPEGTAEFDRQYWEILGGKKIEVATSWRALIDSYRGSDRWTNLKPRTRADYEKVLTYILEKNGSRDMTRLSRKEVIAAQMANQHRIRFANMIAAVISVLCEHAIDIGWINQNPAHGARKIPIPEDRKQPHNPWTDEAVAKWRSEAEFLPRLAFEIGVGSVQRPGDWVEFKWGDYDGGVLRLVQNKSGRALTLPCTDALTAALDKAKKQLQFTPLPTRPILTTHSGQKMSYDYLSKMMRRERKRLGLMTFDLHALRYRGVMELAWAGCSDAEIESYSGHASKVMIRKYAGVARQIMNARSANEKRQLWSTL